MNKKIILIVLLLNLPLVLSGCSENRVHYGEKIPGKVKIVKLSEVINNPEEYKDREVVLEGNYSNYCCASDFVYKEGLEAVEVLPKGFPTPRLDRGKRLKIFGVIRVNEKGFKPEEGDHEIYIEARGLEVK